VELVSANLVDDRGQALDAGYFVEADGGHLALILESRSGMSGVRAPRNPDYNRALTVLLTRLGALDAVLLDALVDSRKTRQLGVPEADRKLIESPIRLALEPDLEALRRRMGRSRPGRFRLLGRPRGATPPSASGCALMFRGTGWATQPAWTRCSQFQ